MPPLFIPSSNNSTPRKRRFSSAPVTPSSSNSTPRKRPWSVGHVPSSPSSRDSTPKTRRRTATFEGSPRESSRRWYGPETRKACLRGAENRRPPVPDECKRGHSGGIRLQMCYAMRSAGLFLGYCHECPAGSQFFDIPGQVPLEKGHAEEIEEIRAAEEREKERQDQEEADAALAYSIAQAEENDMNADSAFSVKHERAEDLPTKVDPGQAVSVKEESAQDVFGNCTSNYQAYVKTERAIPNKRKQTPSNEEPSTPTKVKTKTSRVDASQTTPKSPKKREAVTREYDPSSPRKRVKVKGEDGAKDDHATPKGPSGPESDNAKEARVAVDKGKGKQLPEPSQSVSDDSDIEFLDDGVWKPMISPINSRHVSRPAPTSASDVELVEERCGGHQKRASKAGGDKQVDAALDDSEVEVIGDFTKKSKQRDTKAVHKKNAVLDDEVIIISDEETPLPSTSKKTMRVASFTPAQVEMFKRQGSKNDPISIDELDSGSEADVVAMV